MLALSTSILPLALLIDATVLYVLDLNEQFRS